MGFFQTFWAWLNQTLTGYIGNNTARVSAALEPAIVTLSTVYLMVWGYLHLTGRVGMAPRDVNLLGCGFTEQTQVKLNGVARQFQLVAANKITVTLNSADVNSPGVIAVDVSAGGAQSAPAGNQAP